MNKRLEQFGLYWMDFPVKTRFEGWMILHKGMIKYGVVKPNLIFGFEWLAYTLYGPFHKLNCNSHSQAKEFVENKILELIPEDAIPWE